MSDINLRVAMKGLIVDEQGRILILRESNTYVEGTQIGRYHVPGGRVNPGENFEVALKREIMEETGLQVDVLYPIYVGEWRPVIKGVPNQIIATFNVCRAKSTNGKLSEEHDDYQWIDPIDSNNFDMMGPEDEVIARYLEWQKNGLPK